MYLARDLTAASFPDIGERFGNRDHSTVIHAWKTVGRKMSEDDGLRSASRSDRALPSERQ